ncbi:MAG: dTDP-glucose 4,6-dehydratase [Candidatus Doudnabacteria bacterium]|nr:dTDP-glucose 4,6-dehydratase [Candidatus Doudnabacteria bacterium]
MQTILVTGGAGFIGSNFVRYMLDTHKDIRIINLDKLTYSGRIENIEMHDTDDRHEFVQGDIANKELVEYVVKKYNVDTIVNFAAESHVDRSIHGGREFVRTNVEGVQVLLEVTRDMGLERFHQISTDEVYGDLEAGGFATEESLLVPSSVYSATKAAAEMLVMAFKRTHDTPVTTTRCTNNYGPYHFPEKVIPLFITNLMEDKKVPVYGDGGQVRDWLYVTDHCSAIDLVLQKGELGEIYSVSARNEPEITNLELTKTILKHLGKDESYIQEVEDRAGHDRRYAVEGSKIRELGWKPAVSFDEGIAKTVQWYKDNEAWWRPIKESKELGSFFSVNYKIKQNEEGKAEAVRA